MQEKILQLVSHQNLRHGPLGTEKRLRMAVPLLPRAVFLRQMCASRHAQSLHENVSYFGWTDGSALETERFFLDLLLEYGRG